MLAAIIYHPKKLEDPMSRDREGEVVQFFSNRNSEQQIPLDTLNRLLQYAINEDHKKSRRIICDYFNKNTGFFQSMWSWSLKNSLTSLCSNNKEEL